MSKSSIKKNFLFNVSYQLLSVFVPLATTPYVSRVLGVEGVGIFSYTFAIAQYFMLFILLGLNNYGNRTIAQIRNNKEQMSKCFSEIYGMQLIVGVFIFCLYLVYSIFFSENERLSLLMSILVFSSILDINWFFFGIEEFKLIIVRNFIIKLGSLISVFLFVKGENALYIYAFVNVLSILFSQVALVPFLRKYIFFTLPSLTGILKHIKPNLILFLTVIATSIYNIINKIILGYVTTPIEVGLYESSLKIVAIPTLLITALGTVMLPRMSNLVANNDTGYEQLLAKSFVFALFISSVIAFGIMGVSKEFVPIFYGKGYEKCVELFLILLPTGIFFAIGNVIRTQVLIPRSMDKIYVISGFLGAGVNLLINLILIPYYGAIGAAIGTFFAEAFVSLFQLYKGRKYLYINQYTTLIISFLLSGIVMFFLIFCFDFKADIWLNFLFKIIIGIIVYFFSLFLLIKCFRVPKNILMLK
ncbi:flippase [Gallibacterium anatis]|uniref:flippase n=1 Tax=Gallibacterium anatis TaxID=750 RepID=UPI0005321599|nr:flippase [Gallibacterium anatis]KGQ41812.1 hypothetical protein JP30_02925 [Gallibacterium anatis IPDH697-78]MDK9560456.1 flippase [Gallibacterium anatis]